MVVCLLVMASLLVACMWASGHSMGRSSRWVLSLGGAFRSTRALVGCSVLLLFVTPAL